MAYRETDYEEKNDVTLSDIEISRKKRADLISIIQAVGVLISLIIFIPTIAQHSEWQYYVLGGVILLTVITAFASYTYTHQGRVGLGIGLLLTGIQVALITIAALISGIGLPIGLIILILSMIAAASSLNNPQTTRALIASVAASMLAILLNIFALFPQISIPPLVTAVPIITAASVLLYFLLLMIKFINPTMLIRLVTAFLTIVLVPLIILAALNTNRLQNVITSEEHRALSIAAEQTAQTIDTFINNNLAAVKSESQIVIFSKYLETSVLTRNIGSQVNQVLDTLDGLKSKDSLLINSYAILDDKGYDILDTNRNYLYQRYNNHSYFKVPMETGEAYVSQIEFSPDTNLPFIYFSSPIKDTEGNPLGVLRIKYDAVAFQKILNQHFNLVGENSRPILFDQYHIRLADTMVSENAFRSVVPLSPIVIETLKGNFRLPNRSNEELATNEPLLDAALTNFKTNPYFTLEINGTNQAGAIAQMSSNSWLIAYIQQEDVFLAPIEEQVRSSTIVVAILSGIIAALAIAMAQLLSRPIIKLTQTAQDITSGNLKSRATVTSSDEIGSLGIAFNAMTDQVNSLIENLEQRVQDRTKDLERRANELKTVSDISKDVALIDDLDELLNQAIELIRERFDFYHASIFLADTKNEYAVLKASTGEAGQLLLERKHKLKIGEVGIVGYAVGKGEPRISMAVKEDEAHYRNPLLPDTQSEMALPLKLGDRVIGALDVQSREENAFSEEDIRVLQVMADQLAVAIERAQLLSTLQENIKEIEKAAQRYTKDQWQSYLTTANKIHGYKYDLFSLEETDNTDLNALEALQKGETIQFVDGSLNTENDGGPFTSLAIPVKLRNQVLGVLNLRFKGKTIHPDIVTLIENASNRLALALENARLLQEIQEQAGREHIVSDITSKVRASSNVDDILKTAIKEIGEALGVSEVLIQLQNDDN